MLTVRDVTQIHELQQMTTHNQHLSLLFASVTHEVMTPLNCISTFSDHLVR